MRRYDAISRTTWNDIFSFLGPPWSPHPTGKHISYESIKIKQTLHQLSFTSSRAQSHEGGKQINIFDGRREREGVQSNLRRQTIVDRAFRLQPHCLSRSRQLSYRTSGVRCDVDRKDKLKTDKKKPTKRFRIEARPKPIRFWACQIMLNSMTKQKVKW